MIISSVIYYVKQLQGYSYEVDEKIVGLIIYVMHDDYTEILSRNRFTVTIYY